MKERDLLDRDNLHDQGIYHHFGSEAHRAVALIVGPQDTPYANGFYLFEFVFPNSYPLKPPHVTFQTGDGRVRFNPNLYVNGKVCLSILGTWQGPSWTSSCTFRSTLLSIQSLLCSRPLQNEPGHETDVGKDCDLYSAMLRYENVAVAVLQLARPLPEPLNPLRPTMARLLVRYFVNYLQVLDDFEDRDGQSDRCPLFGFSTTYMPRTVRQTLETLRKALLDDDDLNAELLQETQAEDGGLASSASKPTTADELVATTPMLAHEAPSVDAPPHKRRHTNMVSL